jgi:hypothetical protein
MKSVLFECLNCGKNHTSLNKYSCLAKYCSKQCQQDFQMKEKVAAGTASAKTMKKYLLYMHGEKCWECGITEWNKKHIVFELEHIDGNSENNSENNLSLLCPNCHSQTDTYKNKNKGNGRHSRRVRYSEGKSY